MDKLNIWHVYRLLGQIAAPIRESPTNSQEEIYIALVLENFNFSTARRGGCHSALSKTFHDEGLSCNVVVTKPTNREFKRNITDMTSFSPAKVVEGDNAVTGFQDGHVISIGEKRRVPICERPGHMELDGKRCKLKTARRI
jgi:hypothetical protein